MAHGADLGPRQRNKRGNESVPRGQDIPDRVPDPNSRSDRRAGQDRIDEKGVGFNEEVHERPLTDPTGH